MVVEDEFITAEHLRRSLRDFGYEVCAVTSSAAEAIREAHTRPPDLVLMDIILKGGIDGVEVAQYLRSRFDAPIIFITAYGNKEIMERAKQAEPYGYILKPFQARELQTAIEMALYRRQKEMKQRDTEQWRLAALNTIEEAVIVTNTDGEIIFINSGAGKLTEWEIDAALGRRLSSLIAVSDREDDRNADDLSKRFIDAAEKNDIWIQVSFRNKPEKQIELRPLVVSGPSGNPKFLIALLREIEESQTGSLAPFCFVDTEAVLETLENMALIIDEDYRIKKINSLLAKRIGHSKEEIIGTSCYDRMHRSSAPCSDCPHGQVLSDRKPHAARVNCGGLKADFNIASFPLIGAGGSLQGSVTLLSELDKDAAGEASQEQLFKDVKRFTHEANRTEEILLLCSSCNRIGLRDDSWQDLQSFLKRRMGVQVRRTVCSECSENS